MREKMIRVLFPNWVDDHNYNAQSLNAREIALRLDPRRFLSTLFYQRSPDPRLHDHPSIELIRVPPRLGTLKMLAKALTGFDLIFRANMTRFTYLFFHIPERLRRGTAVVDWLEGYESNTRHVTPQWRKYADFIQPRVTRRVAITEYVARKHLEDRGHRAMGIIPVGVDTGLFTPPPKRSREIPVVLFIGTLIARKNPHLVLVAARRFPHVRFIMVGEKRGSLYLRFQRLMDHWNLGNVTLLNPMPQNKLVELMHGSDILFHPSKSEGFPKVVLEGAATGLPAIISGHYEAPAVVDGTTGFQVRRLNEMLNYLELLIENRALRSRMGEAAVKHAQQFDWSLIVRRWEQVFQGIVAE